MLLKLIFVLHFDIIFNNGVYLVNGVLASIRRLHC